jgi:plasmid stabilization system protein ParE
MTHPNLEIHPAAIREARAARQWYQARSASAAQRFVVEVEEAVHRVLDDPATFPTYIHGTQRCLLRGFPYLLVYRRTEAAVVIIAIAHGRRRPGYWKRRLAN